MSKLTRPPVLDLQVQAAGADLGSVRSVSYLLVALVIPVVALVGLGRVGHATAAASHVTDVRVTERDFHISAPKQVAGGDLLLTVYNKGPDTHELIVVRAPSARLPLRGDGLTVNEEVLRPVTQKSLDPGEPGSVRDLRFHLRPGRYVLFCNMAGHFRAGMHTGLVVR
jgi:uncharacterized cupredoxin-like copper-binding protein